MEGGTEVGLSLTADGGVGCGTCICTEVGVLTAGGSVGGGICTEVGIDGWWWCWRWYN